MYTPTFRYQRTCDAIDPNAPSQEVGHWSAIMLHTSRVFIDPTQRVLFKIPMPPMVRATIIEYAHRVYLIIDLGSSQVNNHPRSFCTCADTTNLGYIIEYVRDGKMVE